MKFTELPEFAKELKKLKKKYKTLDNDLDILQRAITVTPAGNGSKHWACLRQADGIAIYKVRMACATLRGKSLRVIYAYHLATDKYEMIALIEIYFKGNKEAENTERINDYLSYVQGGVKA